MGAAGSTQLLRATEAALADGAEQLDLSNERIAVLPPAFIAAASYATHLTDLRLSSTGLTSLPASFGRLVALERLALDRNLLKELPISFHELRRLRTLDVSYNQLGGLLGNFCDLESLEHLWLQSNKLPELPTALGNLRRLQSLFVQNNVLRGLPYSIVLLPGLQVLDASDNHIVDLPVEWETCRALRTLRLAHNYLAAVPTGLWDLPELEILTLAFNRLVALPRPTPEATMPSLTNLSGLRRSAAADELTASVGLSFNRLDDFLPSLANMPKLRVLTYTQNKLATFDAGRAAFFGLLDLVFLDLSENAIVSLPAGGDGLGWEVLAHLVELHVTNNRLKSVPPGLERLPQLKFLNISGNQLESLPDCIGDLATLETLWCNGNELRGLPPTIERWTQLHTLAIEHNPMTRVPLALASLESLTTLSMDRKSFALLDPALITFCNSLPSFEIHGL
ncbi:hypothetical protein ACHHYP_01188 [Achlya hypogyna]|uniref:Disease resistance R13L4/SHOC-2-like LRR domain-containing protein n=1 Tax=Achlya hypogyna TaxID=1202772 RepID=A0A1V9ZTK9_ACHHY|nr:hypothetical protein ACHHYP_01188 [Achlya hypogyna]